MEYDTNYAVGKAMELFDQQKYREALGAFIEIYNHSQIAAQRQEIFHMLEEAYYTPNIVELQNIYEKNLELLKEYPYFWGQPFPEYRDLNIQMFPASDEFFYCYDLQKDCFSEEYDAKTSNQMKYFFENLDRPIQVKDENNFYNLTFLNDNVRASEDFAGDNHVYLFYSSAKPLQMLILTSDLEPLLAQKKFVFLVGNENRKRYPINFKKEFGIDYTKMQPQPIRIEELKRICFWYKKPHCGNLLSLSALGASSAIQTVYAHYFNTYSIIDGEPILSSSKLKNAVSDVQRHYTVSQLKHLSSSSEYDLKLDVYTDKQILDMARSLNRKIDSHNTQDYFAWLEQRRPAPHEYTIKELFCAYFLWQYEKRKLNPRIVPVLLFDPHMEDPRIYANIVLSFPYYTSLTTVRDPIMVLARNYNVGMVGGDKFHTQYLLGGDYVHAQFLPPELQKCYYGFRFEDLKTKPEKVCRAVCKHLNVPYDPQMLQADAPWPDMAGGGGITRGFDQAPLHRDLSFMLSEFDQLRLKIFYDPILRHYGYPSFPFEEHPLSDEVVRKLFEYPFHFEHINHTRFVNAPSKENLHAWIQEILQGVWKKGITVPQMIPLEEPGNE